MGYFFWLAARVLLYAPYHRQDGTYHRQDGTYHSFCYTSHEALAGMKNILVGPLWGINPTTHCTMSKHSIKKSALTDNGTARSRHSQRIHYEGSIQQPTAPWADTLPRSYISLPYMKKSALTRHSQRIHYEGSIQQPWAGTLSRIFLVPASAPRLV